MKSQEAFSHAGSPEPSLHFGVVGGEAVVILRGVRTTLGPVEEVVRAMRDYLVERGDRAT